MSVAQFLAQEENAEKYRHVFVNHNGSMELSVDVTLFGIKVRSPETNKNGWPMFVDEIVRLIDNNTNGEIKNVNVVEKYADFSIQNYLISDNDRWIFDDRKNRIDCI
jgi:hypothetical protein